MSELISKEDGSPFVTETAAKAARTRMGREGLDVNVVAIDGGFALERRPYEKPAKRVPLGTRNVFSFPSDVKAPGFEHRLVTDEGDRLRRFRDAGWEVVESRKGVQVGEQSVGAGQLGSLVTKSVGGNKTGYLMRIPKKFYDEDQAAKAEKIQQGESDLKQEQHKKGRYGEISIGERQKQY